MPRQPLSAHGPLFVLLAAMMWGTTGTAQAFAPASFDPLVIGTLRLVLGGAALSLLYLGLRGPVRSDKWPVGITLGAAFFTAAYQACFFAGVAKTGVAVGTIVGIGSSPMAAGILEYMVYGSRPRRRWMAATTLAIGGCALLSLSGGDEVRIDPLGMFLAVGAGISYAAYTLYIKRLLKDHSPDAVMAVVFCLGGLMLSPLLIGRELQWLVQPRSVAIIAHLGLITAALAYWLFARGLKAVPAATAVTLSLAEPLTAGVLGVTVLGEKLNAAAASGIGLIFCGLALLTVRFRALTRTGRARPIG